MILSRLKKIVKRHPFLYLTRFRLLSKNASFNEVNKQYYNKINLKKEVPAYFHEINGLIFSETSNYTDLEKIKKLALWLQKNVKGGPGLSLSSEKALKVMLNGGGGVCSDLVQIINNFCVINDIRVREWGTTRIPFDKNYGGHSFNEIFIGEKNKWVLIDVYYGVFFTTQNGKPLSVIEFFRVKETEENILIEYLSENFESDVKAIKKIYFHEDASPFLICNYSNKLYDKYLKLLSGKFPIFLIHFLIYVQGRSYFYIFPLNNYKAMFRRVEFG